MTEIEKESDSEFLNHLTEAYLDPELPIYERDNVIFRMLKFRFEEDMSPERLARDNHIAKKYLNKDGTVKDAEYREYQKQKDLEYQRQFENNEPQKRVTKSPSIRPATIGALKKISKK